MRGVFIAISIFISFLLGSCAHTKANDSRQSYSSLSATQSEELELEPREARPDYAMRLPQHINTREKVIVVYPNVHAWSANIFAPTAGDNWCEDVGRPCRTRAGSF